MAKVFTFLSVILALLLTRTLSWRFYNATGPR